MTKEKLKIEFHKLIDNIDDVDLLEKFFDVLSEIKNGNESIDKKDIIDELSEKQQIRLMQSIEQVSDKDIIDNDKMREEIKSWLSK